MKNIFSTTLLAGLSLLMAKNEVSAQTGYTINGRIADFDQPTMAYLYKFTEKGRELIDSSTVNNGVFNFRGVLQHPVSAAVQIRKMRRSLNLFLENENFQLLMQSDWKNKEEIHGGKEMGIKAAYETETASLSAQMREIGGRYEKLPKEDRLKENEELTVLNAKEMDIKYKYIRKYPSSLAVLNIMRPQFEVMNLKELREMKSLFSPELSYAPEYKKLLRLLEQKAAASLVGQQAPDFSGTTLAGKSFTLSALKGKYVVLDFWASWCTPCRAANQKIKPIYEHYKNKGFEMVSLSMDDKRNLWENAVKKDGLPWIQVSELSGIKDSAVAQKYSVVSLPTVFLLDKTGKVIAQNISEKELEELLNHNLNK
ncbi:Peroxiredoxin [Pedobacter steynii]|uniref:Peroxiredoxin n=1 Tax=Pedobacter steynii TaxID=430522 RepID=A0A1G9MQ54_9SPHI|nr:TlpA disulfide reductase family protein [Pedobacter steynii]NQX39536.1 AhpC/TSA family protein [Pedobacter steynii]SDL76151.1 Peroxiredoxin [Pedobacter steynii]